MAEIPGDDSRGFAAVEREHLRSKYLPDFEWMSHDTPSPHNPPLVPLHEARIGLVDTCGAHLVDQPPVGASGRAALVPLHGQVTFTHPGFDVARAEQDPEVVHPAQTLLQLAEDGVVGSVAPTSVSVMGGVLLGTRLQERGVPVMLESMRSQSVDLALLVPAWPVCQQSVGLLQRALDEAGIPTVSVTQVPEITEMLKPSLACFVAMPFGLTLGAVGDAATHRAIVQAALQEAYREHTAGDIVPLDFRWDRDDLRARQLRKQAL